MMSTLREPIPSVAMHYQPIVSVTTGAMVGCEALVRMPGADGRPCSQPSTIARLEASVETASALTSAVLREVDRDLVPILQAHSKFYVSVNVPPIVLGNGQAAVVMRELALVNHLPQMVVEITERQALTDQGRRALRMAREAGMRVAVDDFGTGESGLMQLLGLEFDVLKIDRAQIVPLFASLPAERLLRGVVALAGALRVMVVAEGIETPEQALFIRAAGVDYGQGWYWSKAVRATELAGLIARGFTVPSAAF